MQPVSAINSFPAASAIVPQGNLGGRNVLNLNARGVDAFLASAVQFCKKAFTAVKNAVVTAFAFVMRYLNIAWNWMKSTYSANPRLFQVGAAAFAAGAALVAAINACRNKQPQQPNGKPEETPNEERAADRSRTEHVETNRSRTDGTNEPRRSSGRSNNHTDSYGDTNEQPTRRSRQSSRPNQIFAPMTDANGRPLVDSNNRPLFVQQA